MESESNSEGGHDPLRNHELYLFETVYHWKGNKFIYRCNATDARGALTKAEGYLQQTVDDYRILSIYPLRDYGCVSRNIDWGKLK